MVAPSAIRVDTEIVALIPFLAASEFDLLEESLKQEGLRDPLVVWQEKSIRIVVSNGKESCGVDELESFALTVVFLRIACEGRQSCL